MASIKQTEKLRQRTSVKSGKGVVQTQWFIKEVTDHVNITLRKRMRIAVNFLKDKIVLNIRKPVTKSIGPRGGLVVTNRSKPGEFPKADTTQLMRTLLTEVRNVSPGVTDGFVGSPLDYSLFIELDINRSFLLRTFNEEIDTLQKIVLAPITNFPITR